MSYAVKYKTNKGEEEMKKRRVAKLIALIEKTEDLDKNSYKQI